MSIRTTIETFYPSLSKTEKKIADYVLEQGEKVGYQTLQEIASIINVGEASILRFCRKIGLNSFNSLKLLVSKEETKDEAFENYLQQIQSSLHTAIDNTYSLLNFDSIDEAVGLINRARRIFLCGVGSSGVTALEAQSKFLRYGKLCYMMQDSHFQMMSAAITDENDVIVVFSLSGYTSEIIDILEIAKMNNTKIICITNHVLSPVARLSHLVILSYGKENFLTGGSLSAKISQMFIVDALCTGYALLNKEKSQTMREKTTQAIIQKVEER